jgi:hypothetical protein
MWQTWTCTLGFPVMGIWCDGWDRTDVNAVSRSDDGKLIAFGDDFGKIHLVNAPCLIKHAPRRCYRGHSSHVADISFLKDGHRVVSCGGRDKSVFQYRVVRVFEEGGEAERAAGGAGADSSLMLREGTSGRLKTTQFDGGAAAAGGDKAGGGSGGGWGKDTSAYGYPHHEDDEDPDAKGERWGEYVVLPHKGIPKPAWLKLRYNNGPPVPQQRRLSGGGGGGSGGGGGGGGGYQTTARSKTR